MNPTNADDSLAGSLAGDSDAQRKLLELVYDELRAIAKSRMRRERPNHTLQPTALVHEAFLRLVRQNPANAKSRTQFLALASTMMRRILIDHARSKGAIVHGGGKVVRSLEDEDAPRWCDPAEVLALDEALSELAEKRPRQAKVVELLFFGGLTQAEAAETLEVSRDTVKLDWRFSRAWLNRRLGGPA